MKKDIIVRFKGGIGNQMFQYLFYLSLLKQGHSVYAERQLIENSGQKNTIFDYFDLNVSFRKLTFIDSLKRLLLRIHKRIFGTRIRLDNYVLDERQIINNYAFIEPGDILEGYWQNPTLFSLSKDDIDLIFSLSSLKVEIKSDHLKLISLIEKQDALVIHVRKGDYLGNPLFDGICDDKYYNNAVGKFNGINETYIFTNDADWVKNNLEFDYIILAENHPAIDLILMSKAKNLIISNSTYSWWAAYLNNEIIKNVLAPKKWFNSNDFYFKGHLEDWMKL